MTSTITDRIAGLSTSVSMKAPVKAATTANITLSGAQTIDGISVTTDDYVLVKNQTTTTENGIYTVSTGSWTRREDFDGERDVVTGTLVFVTSGTTNADTLWRVSTSGNPSPGDAMAFTQVQTTGATGATGATGSQGPAGADGTVDITTLAAETDPANDDLLLLYDTSQGANNKMTTLNFFKTVDTLAEETAPAGTADFIPIYDTSGTACDKMTPVNLLKSVNDATEDTTPAGTTDYVLTYDASATAAKKVTPVNLFKTINDATEDTSPDVTADYFIMYDSSASAGKKVLPTNIFKGINSLTADASPDTAADYVVTYDASTGVAKKVLLNLIGSGAAATTTSSGNVELATAAEVQTGTDTARVPSVSVMGSHQSAAKFWVRSPGSSTVTDSYNVTSITDNGIGDFTITIATDFANANWACFGTARNTASGADKLSRFCSVNNTSGIAAGTVRIQTFDYLEASAASCDPVDAEFYVCGFGDQ